MRDSTRISSGIVTLGPKRAVATTGKATLTGKNPLTINPCDSMVPRIGNEAISALGCMAGTSSCSPSKCFIHASSQKEENISLHTPPVSTARSFS